MTDANAGTGKTVTATVTLTDPNYSLATNTINTTVNIAKIEATTAMKTASGQVSINGKTDAPATLPALPAGARYSKATYSGDITCFNAAVNGTTLTFDAPSSIAGQTGTITLLVTGATNYDDYNLVVTVTSVAKTPVTITGVSAATSLTYNGSAQAGVTGTATVTDHAELDAGLEKVYYLEDGTTKTTNANSGAASEGAVPKNAGSYKYIVSVPESNDTYTGSLTVSFSIGKKPVTAPAADNTVFTYTGQAQTYGISATADYTVTGSTQTNANESGYSVTVALKDKDNTQWADTNNTVDKSLNFIIAKAAATVKADDKSKVEGRDDPAFTYTSSGFVNGETITGVGFDVKGTVITPKDGTVSGGGAGNYTITYTPGTLTIKPKQEVLTETITAAKSAKTGVIASDKTAAEVASGQKFVPTALMTALDEAIAAAEKQVSPAAQLSLRSSDPVLEAIDNLNSALTNFNSGIKTGTYVAPSSGGSYTPSFVTEIKQGGSTTADNLSRLVSGKKDLTVTGTNGAKLVFDTTSLKGIDAKTTGRVTVKIEDVSKAHQDMAGKNVFSLTVESGGKTVTDFGGSVTVTLPYTLKDGEKAEDVSVWYLASDGTMTELPCTYDAKTGLATFTVTHFSEYVVGVSEWVNPFKDVKETDWCYSAVEYANKNGLFAGTSETTFSPSAPMTRQMLWTVLGRLDGQTLTGSGVFDAAKTWATGKGITDGSNPTGQITREQLVTILWRYAGSPMLADYPGLAQYSDAGDIASYAQQAMAWAHQKGIISGTSTTTLNPSDTATRAQVAAIVMRYAQSAAK